MKSIIPVLLAFPLMCQAADKGQPKTLPDPPDKPAVEAKPSHVHAKEKAGTQRPKRSERRMADAGEKGDSIVGGPHGGEQMERVMNGMKKEEGPKPGPSESPRPGPSETPKK